MNLWRRFLTYQTLSSYTVPLNQPIMNYEWESLTRPLFLPQALVSTSLPLETSTLLPRLATLIGSLLYVYKSNHSIFTYYDNKLDFPNFTAFYDFVNVSASTILNINPSSSSSSSSSSKDVVGTESLQYYHYYSGNLMQEKLSPLRQFLDTGMWVRQLIKGRPVTALLWLGGKGVQASGHYDTVYNVFVHLAGVKVVRLVAPRYASQLGFFGRNHPHACQSRYADIKSRTLLNITYRCVHDRECAFSKESEGYGKVEEDDSENDHQFQIQEFTLRSGDVLFIPPFWTHEVVAETASVSASLWWDARVLDIMDDVYSLPLPFESNWSDEVKMLAVISFTKSLILAIVDEVHIHYQSFSCSSKTVGKVESDSPLPILTTKDFIRLIRMRYPADLTCIKRSDIQCEDTMQMDISGINTGTEPWQEQVRNRQRAFVKIFQRFLLTDIGIASTDTCVDISDNEIKRDQAMILAIKVLDFVEDVFRHMLPPPMHHPALGLLSLHSCLIETNTEMVNIK